MISGLVFDMDGLLLDSERIVKRSWEEAGNEMGIPGMGEHIFHTLGLNRAGRDAYFRKALGEDFGIAEFSERMSRFFYRIVDEEGLPLKTGVKELLPYAKARGYIHILTGACLEIWCRIRSLIPRYTERHVNALTRRQSAVSPSRTPRQAYALPMMQGLR